MLFNSFQFIWLFPIIFVVYYSFQLILGKNGKIKLQHRGSNILLLIFSYLLYAQWNLVYTLLLLGITMITYIGARRVSKYEGNTRKKSLMFIFVLLSILPLLTFKYYDFIHFQIGNLLSAFNIGEIRLEGINWAIPLGISFYTFQAVGYLIDVYYKRVGVEKNWWDYMLFVSFFPQIMAGPISRAADLLPQIKAKRDFDYNQAVIGCKLLLWGMFLKVVFADKIGSLVDIILPNYIYQSGKNCAFGAILYSLQIYGDFAGYSLMAVGVGKIMGFNLIKNFNRPYFSVSITEFWKRWHISLTKWLTYNIYVPLGGNRCSKLKSYRNILITFIVSGIWHGANWTYIFWGTLHGGLQIGEKALGLQKCENKYLKPIRILITFIIVTLAWIFFRVNTIHDGFNIIQKIFSDQSDLKIDAPFMDILVVCMATFIVFIKEWFNEYYPDISVLSNKHMIVRWSSYIALLSIILLCGVFDAGSFIYVSF